MSFVHPLLVWGTLLGAIPIIIHILSRRRYKVIRWAATDFLLAALSERSRNVRIQDLILLLLRVLVLVIAAFVVARPILSPEASGFAGPASGGTDAVIILDTSYSMSMSDAAQSRMELARRRAHEVLSSLPEHARAGVIYAHSEAIQATDGLSADRTRIGAAIDEAEVSPSGSDAAPAVQMALELLESSTAASKRIFLITDAQTQVFESSRTELERLISSADASIGFAVLIVPNAPAPNLAITDISIPSRWLRVGTPLTVEATIENTGQSSIERTDVSLWVDRRKVAQQSATLTDGKARVRFLHPFTAAGLFPIEIRLEHDAVDLDNHRYAAVYIPDSIGTLVVTGKADNTNEESEAHLKPADTYIRAALSDQEAEDISAPPFDVHERVSADRLADELEADIWLVVLADTGTLPAAAHEKLRTFVESGGAVLLSAGPDASASFGAFRAGGQGTGRWLAGLDWQTPEVEPPSDADTETDRDEPMGIVIPENESTPVLDLDSPGVRDALEQVAAFRTLDFSAKAESPWSSVLDWTSGRPALLTRELSIENRPQASATAPASHRPIRAGRLALLTTTIDPRWTDLPYRPAYLPLLVDTCTWLCEPRLISETIQPRQMWSRPLSGSIDAMKILTPGGDSLDAAAFAEKNPRGGYALQFDAVHEPGIFQIVDERASRAGSSNALDAVAVNIDTTESDMSFWSAAEISNLARNNELIVIEPDQTLNASSMTGLTGEEIWKLVATILLIGLIAETLLAFWFGLSKKDKGSPVAVVPSRAKTEGGLT